LKSYARHTWRRGPVNSASVSADVPTGGLKNKYIYKTTTQTHQHSDLDLISPETCFYMDGAAGTERHTGQGRPAACSARVHASATAGATRGTTPRSATRGKMPRRSAWIAPHHRGHRVRRSLATAASDTATINKKDNILCRNLLWAGR